MSRRRIIFSSACATYGIPDHLPITEEHQQRPINPYCRTKLIVEDILKDYDQAYGLKYIVLRYFNAAGADTDCEIGEWHDPETHLIPLILDVALSRAKHVVVYGTDYDTVAGTCIRDYIHVNGLSDVHLLTLEHLLKNERSDTFNLRNENGFSVQEVIEAARRVTGREIPDVETLRRPGDPAVLIGSAQRAKEVLRWKPVYNDLTTIISTAWLWHQKLRDVPDSI